MPSGYHQQIHGLFHNPRIDGPRNGLRTKTEALLTHVEDEVGVVVVGWVGTGPVHSIAAVQLAEVV